MRVAIVGLGLGGATAAAALSQRGLEFIAFEQALRARDVGAGIATWPNTIRLLYRLGLRKRLEEIGVRMHQASVRNKAGELLHVMECNSYDDARGYYFHRAELLQAIAERASAAVIRTGMRCVNAEEFENFVRLCFEDGSHSDFDVVLGADGIKSVLHGVVASPSPPTYSNLAAYRGLVENSSEVALKRSGLWTDRVKYFVAFPVSASRLVNFVGVVPTPGLPEESWFMTGSCDQLAAEFAGWDPLIGRIIAAVRETFRWGIYYREPGRHMVSRRVALIGDAAHPMLIHAGQGAGQAIEDAVALAVMLRGASGDKVPHRLRLYEELRLGRATAVQQASRINAQFTHVNFPLQRGESRPDRTSRTDWIINYDVELEAERILAADGGEASS